MSKVRRYRPAVTMGAVAVNKVVMMWQDPEEHKSHGLNDYQERCL